MVTNLDVVFCKSKETYRDQLASQVGVLQVKVKLFYNKLFKIKNILF
jgi:hypothetical protein